MTRKLKSLATALLLTLAAATTQAAAPAVTTTIDWPSFLAQSDLVWNKLPVEWKEAPFLGNGLLGATVFTADNGKSLRFRIGRTDVTYTGLRIPIGELLLHPVGDIQSGSMRLDLWNATLTGTITTSKGQIKFRSFTHADQLVQVIELSPDAGEAACTFSWSPGLAVNPRTIYQKTPITEKEKNPDPILSESDSIHLSTQPLKNGTEHVTAWTEVSGENNSRTLYLTVAFDKTDTAAPEATATLKKALATPIADLEKSHQNYWHNYWPESFISIPDSRLESFYQIQMYKLASATRPGRPAIDLMGPWFNTTPWPKIWWNLNIQLTYWPVLASNRLELGEPLAKMIDDGADALAKNAGQFSADSATIGRSSSYDCVRPGDSELCDFPWVMHNYYLLYRYSMDDAMLKDRIFPMLKRAVNWYLHHTAIGPDNKLHITDGYSPEYPNQPKPNPDTNIDLSLLRWGCQTLLATCDRLKIDDPLIPKWKETLATLTPYPTDDTGLRISASVPFAVSHRHFSHLLMIFPLYIMNTDQPENRDLVIKSLTHWMGMPAALKGYSYVGASSISSLMGNGDDSLLYLNKLLDSKMIPPNTLYAEAGPCIETPLAAAASVHDMLLSSWGNKIRVFPALPKSWQNVSFANMRTEGAFLVTATRKNGKTQFVQIESLAGEPCRLVTDMPNPAELPTVKQIGPQEYQVSLTGGKIKKIAPNEYEINLAKGQSILLTPNGAVTDLTVSPVAPEEKRINFYGLH